MNKKAAIILYTALLLLLGACKHRADGVLSEKKMVDLLVDIHKTEAVMALNYNQYPNDQSRQATREAVYIRHNTNQAQFDTSLTWYGNHIDIYMKVYEQVIARLNTENEQIKALIAQDNNQILTSPGDTVDIWKQQRVHTFNAAKNENLLTFDIASDENFSPKDRFILDVHTLNVPRNGAKARIYLAVRHDKQNIHYNYTEIQNDGWTTLKIQSDSATRTDNIYGYILLPYRPDNHIMYVDSIRLLRIHEKPGMPQYSYNIIETLSTRITKRPVAKEKDRTPGRTEDSTFHIKQLKLTP